MKVIIYLYSTLFLAALSFALIGNSPKPKNDNLSSRVKVALRNTGNTLLLQSKDSSSLVLPVVALEPDRFQLTFQSELPIIPDSLVASVNKNFEALDLPKNYLVEVIDCGSREVSYSYAISDNLERNIVPCMGRKLPLNCYEINVQFQSIARSSETSMGTPWYAVFLTGTIGLGFLFLMRKKEKDQPNGPIDHSNIGSYVFYQDQNILVKDGVSIKLTSKESELLKIFNDNRNQVVTRDLLLKEVWENKGVFVGRSLDTFISKLRKKFKDDSRISLINVHGVGYKLEVIKNPRR